MRDFRNDGRRRLTRRPRARRTWRALLFGVTILSVLATSTSLVPTPQLVWNTSESAPVGLYWRVAGRPSRGDLVLAWAPHWARELAAERRYLPLNVPVIKRVAAASGDVICAAGDAIVVNGRVAAHRLAVDRLGRPLPWWEGCEVLAAGEFFLLMANVPDSFDGRYFGVTARPDIIGRVVPLWTW